MTKIFENEEQFCSHVTSCNWIRKFWLGIYSQKNIYFYRASPPPPYLLSSLLLHRNLWVKKKGHFCCCNLKIFLAVFWEEKRLFFCQINTSKNFQNFGALRIVRCSAAVALWLDLIIRDLLNRTDPPEIWYGFGRYGSIRSEIQSHRFKSMTIYDSGSI